MVLLVFNVQDFFCTVIAEIILILSLFRGGETEGLSLPVLPHRCPRRCDISIIIHHRKNARSKAGIFILMQIIGHVIPV